MFDRYYCINVSKIVEFDAEFRYIIFGLFCFDYFYTVALVDFHWMISIYILVPGPPNI